MSYIIVWRNNQRDPFVETDSNLFLETYSTYEKAKEEAERIQQEEGYNLKWYFNFKIYEEVES